MFQMKKYLLHRWFTNRWLTKFRRSSWKKSMTQNSGLRLSLMMSASSALTINWTKPTNYEDNFCKHCLWFKEARISCGVFLMQPTETKKPLSGVIKDIRSPVHQLVTFWACLNARSSRQWMALLKAHFVLLVPNQNVTTVPPSDITHLLGQTSPEIGFQIEELATRNKHILIYHRFVFDFQKNILQY